MGIIQSAGLFVCYFVVFNEFGLSPKILNRIITVPYFHHYPSDIYDRNHPTLGNTNLKCENGNLTLKEFISETSLSDGKLLGGGLDWLFTKDKY